MSIRPNPIRAAWKAGQAVFGTFAWSASPRCVEIIGHAGFDYVMFDAEHSPIDAERLEDLIRASEAAGIPPLVRIPYLHPSLITRTLDSGAAGIIVPQVNSLADAQLAVAGAKYHPLGRRGMAVARSAGFGLIAAGDDYRAAANRETLLIVQVETRDAVEQLPSILALPGVDGILIGPNDLSQSLGYPGQLDLPLVQGVIHSIVEQCLAANVPVGMFSGDVATLRYWRDQGCRLLLCGTELDLLAAGAQAALAAWRESKS
ncbi:MAG: aldolase/citrate lyase family protein [Anaerolineae bacterium]